MKNVDEKEKMFAAMPTSEHQKYRKTKYNE